VAPLYESVPPKLYEGTERVVSDLTDEVVRLGHNVTLFASGDAFPRRAVSLIKLLGVSSRIRLRAAKRPIARWETVEHELRFWIVLPVRLFLQACFEPSTLNFLI
jgi:hypothetical protein